MSGPVIVSGIEFDTRSSPVIVSWVEFDVGVPVQEQAPPSDAVTGGRARRSGAAKVAIVAKTAPRTDASHYHSRAYEQDLLAAAQLDDEEVVIAFLMEYALV